MHRSKLFAAILFSIAILLSGFADTQAQGKKKNPGKGSPAPIGIQVAELVDRDKAKVAVTSANVRNAGANVFAELKWDFFAPQGSRVETVDVEVIGEFGNGTGVSEKRSFGAVTSGALFLAEASKHPASKFTNINAKVTVNFRDLNNNQLFAKAAVKNFPVSVKQVPPVSAEPVRLTVKQTQLNGLSAFVFWDVTDVSAGRKVESFEVTITADLDRGQSIETKTQGRTLQNPNDRSTTFSFAQIGVVNALAILKTRVVVVAFVRDLNTNFVDRVTEVREDVFPRPTLPVVNLAVSDFKASLNNLLSVNWTINGDGGSRIKGFEVSLTTIFPDNTQTTQVFQASPQSRNLTRSILPSNGAPDGFKQALATITAKMETTDGRKFDVVAKRKLF